MSSLTMEDMSGKPRSDEDLQEAITACETIMLKHALVLPFFGDILATLDSGTYQRTGKHPKIVAENNCKSSKKSY